MKIVFFIYALLRLLAGNADAEDAYDQPYDEVYKPNIVYNTAQVEIKIVDDADAVCRKYGAKQNFMIQHCTVQWNNPRVCLLIMDKRKLTTGSLGHEMRHCFEGEWHDVDPKDPTIRRR
jgi:hypothetical protein